jgi:membrane protease YdiL (CAAX protease family)
VASQSAARGLTTRRDWLALVFALLTVFGLFHWSATALGSDRGQYGIVVGVLVVTATAAAHAMLFRRRPGTARGPLGLGRPRLTGIAVAVIISAALIISALVVAAATGRTLTFYPGWLSLLPGLFVQAGIAEEVLFRGFLFGQVRVGRTFWRAAALSMLPFAGVHLVLFFLMPWPIALASVLLSIAISFPLARLFELGGHTIWAPALLHFVIQGAVKVLVASPRGEWFALAWMLASTLVPLLVFALGDPDRSR